MRYATFFLSFFLTFGLMVVPVHAGHPVTLKPATELSSKSIRLSDVFDGVPKEIDRDIALSPKAGQSITYDIRVLNHLATKYRLDWNAQSYTDNSLLTRAANIITLDDIRPHITSKINKVELDENTRYNITFDNRSFSLALPADHTPEFKIVNFNYDERGRRFKGTLIAKTQDNAISQPITGRIFVQKRVPVSSGHLKIGDIIGGRDLDWAWKQENKISKDSIKHTSNLIGLEVRQGITTGSMVRTRDVTAPRLVQRGSLVTMRIKTSTMLITAQGRALQDGAKGESVRVKNLQSNRIIEGVVEADGAIQVHTGSVKQLAAL